MISNKTVFRVYIIGIILLATLPLNSNTNLALNNTFVVRIRLDHLLHGLMMAPYAVLFSRSYRGRILLMLLSGILTSTLLEGVQYFLPYRAYNINDMLSNYIGLAAGLLFFGISKLYLVNRHPTES